MPNSLRQRFFSHTALVLVAVMLVSSFVIDFSHRSELDKSAVERLRLHVFTLLSVAERDNGILQLPAVLRNPGFNAENSGLWATVLNENEKPIWQSLSITNLPTNKLPEQKVGSWKTIRQKLNGKHYLITSYKIAWAHENGIESYYFIAAEDEKEIADEMRLFRWRLFSAFILITISLLLGQHIVLRLSFKPISDLGEEITRLESGKQNRLQNEYPLELQGVSKNLNTLIQKEYTQREKYRSSMADLAHSLKTPLAIIKIELQDYPSNNNLQNAITRVNESIEYHLRRAVIEGHVVLSGGTDINDVLESLIEVLAKVHTDSEIHVSKEIENTKGQNLKFMGDDNDLMEIFGNLLDNAYRHAKKEILIKVYQTNKQLIMSVEDDGLGISSEDAKKIFNRGERLDCQKSGQGIGLSVVGNIVRSYQGSIQVSKSTLGGACFTLEFPAKEES